MYLRVIILRWVQFLQKKKLYVQALRYLQKCINLWAGEEVELAQVYNAVGFVYVELNDIDQALFFLNKAVTIQPSYVSAWNNLGDIHERKEEYQKALCCYEEVLMFDKVNVIALNRKSLCEKKIQSLKLQ
jgi:tetratricopeptide (TPR) repeat protein